jgi:peptidoglycan/xylan/chitin deacetylase (PgdA/CDA1 family)
MKLVISLAVVLARGALRTIGKLCGRVPLYPLVVLTYHGVGGRQRPAFSRQMDVAARYARLVSAASCGTGSSLFPRLAVTFDDGFRSFRENALPKLSEMNVPCTLFVPAGFVGRAATWVPAGCVRYRDEVVMCAEELALLPQSSICIGSHAWTHADLTTLPAECVRMELSQSKTCLEALLGREVTTLAFPYGEYNAEVLALCREVGFRRVFSNLPVAPDSSETGFHVGRLNVDPDDLAIEYWLKIRGGYSWLPAAVRLKRTIRTTVGLRRRGRILLPPLENQDENRER